MELNQLIESLHPLERKVLPHISSSKSLTDLLSKSGMQEIEARRALQWLAAKQLVSLKEESEELVQLGANGRKYAAEGLPEMQLYKFLKKGSLQIKEIEKSGLNREESAACLGILRNKGLIDIKQGVISLTQKKADFAEEDFLQKLPMMKKELSKEQAVILVALMRRKEIVQLAAEKTLSASLTQLGREVIKAGMNTQVIDTLSSSLLRSGEWKGKTFRRYELSSAVPKRYAGRKQHYRRFLDSVREKFMALGFEEMFGPIVESDFWDMDALFMPQFHSARDIHDAYYIKEPKYATGLPAELVKRVKASHENGYGTGSIGWRYPFDERRTARLLLRTQGTACSARKLATDVKIPGKYFAIARCFRYDVIDATHLPDFHQTEGIVAEEGLTLRHLFGLLEMFAREFADAQQVKITPAYFPFTEPSATLYAKHPQMGWIELAGAGIFRPEMTKALGIKVPVLAWGIGIDRIAMFKLGLNDIRELFSHDLSFLRTTRMV